MSRKFKWVMWWDFDLDGSAYVIAKDECPNKKDVSAYIVHEDGLHPDVLNPELGECLCPEIVQEGWCKFQVRSDWWGYEGKPGGRYVAHFGTHDKPHSRKGPHSRCWEFNPWLLKED